MSNKLINNKINLLNKFLKKNARVDLTWNSP